MNGFLFSEDPPVPAAKPPRLEVGVETAADGRKAMTITSTDDAGTVVVVWYPEEKQAVGLWNQIGQAMHKAWPLAKD